MTLFAKRTGKAAARTGKAAARTGKAAARTGKAAVVIALILTALAWSLTSGGPEPTSADEDPVTLPPLDDGRPVLIVARGWLWDPESRVETGPLKTFPIGVAERLAAHGLEPQIYEFPWSRIPHDLASASQRFTEFASQAAAWGAKHERCVSFAGHSAGAVMVYRAASRGVPMGVMATVGSPLPAPSRPDGVFLWVDAYTTSHRRDLAGRLWGGQSEADLSVDTGVKHKDLWGTNAVMDLISQGLVRSFEDCRPG